MKYALKWACFLVTFQFHCYSCQDGGKRQESNNSIETSEILGNSTSCPFESTNQEGILEICKFWIQGVLITLIGLFGITGNLVNSYVHTLPFKMFGPFGSVWCKTALAEVGLSLP